MYMWNVSKYWLLHNNFKNYLMAKGNIPGEDTHTNYG